MYVVRIFSINEGWSILTTDKAKEWEEALAALNSFDEDFCLKAIKSEDSLLERGASTNPRYMAFYTFLMYNKLLHNLFDWTDTLPDLNKNAKSSHDLQFIKNGVSAAMVGVNALTKGDFITTLYLNLPYYYHSDLIEVSVIFIPTTAMIDYLLALGANPISLEELPTEEICRAEFAKFSSLTSQVPIVLAFYSPTEAEQVTLEEIVPVKIGGHTIERTLEFAPEYYQASVGLLSYFGEVLRQKDPNTKAKVRIEQEGNIVRLRIESPSGDIEIIEKELEQYALVLNNQAPPESLLENQAHIIQLKSQLEMARLQIQTAYEIKQITDGVNAQRITSLEKQVETLNTQIAAQLLQNSKVIDLATRQNESHERLQAALLIHSGMLFKDLLQEASGNQQLLEAVASLRQTLLTGLTTIDVEEQIKQALETVKQTKPGMLSRIYTQVEGAAMKTGAGASLAWASKLIRQHLK